MYSYKTGLGQVWVGAKLPPNPGSNIIWLRPSDDHRVLWEIRTYNIYKERWEVLTSAALTADGLLILIRDLEKRCKSLEELKVVLYDTIQNLTPEEQKIARQNIGAISLEDLHFDENVTRLAIELTINDEKVYSVVTPLETLTEHYRKFLADPTKYVWQLYLKVGEDQLGLVPLFIITYGGLHIGFYSPDLSGETKYVSLNTNGDVVIRATVNNYGPTLVEVVQSTGDSTEKVMSQKAVTEELSKKASLESVTESISVHNTSSTSHADIRNLLNTCVGLPTYDSSSYKITFTTLAGASVEIDLPIEQLALRYNVETDSIEFDNADGTTTSIPVSAFVKEYVGSIGDRIQVSIDKNNVIHATVLKNSIDWDCLSFELQERINDHVTSADFATKAVRTDIAQTLSAAQQEQAWLNLGFDLVVLKFPEGATSVTLTDEDDTKLRSGAAVLVTVDGTNTSSGIYNADNHIFASYNFTNVSRPTYYSLWSHTSVLYCSYNKASKTFVYRGSLQLNDTGALRTDRLTSLTSAQQSQAFENLGWKVHVISESAIGSSDAVSDDEKAARLSTTALLVQETGLLYNFSISSGGSRRFYGQFSNSFCTALNVNEATGVITSSFAYLYDPSAVSFDRDQSSVSDDNKNKALGNIGIDLVRIPYSLLGTTLSDEMFAVLDNARGIILVDTPSDYRNPTVFIKGNDVSGSCLFVSFVTGNTYSIFTFNKSTKLLSGISTGLTYGGSVRYAEVQNLTTSQQDTALSNIGLNFINVDYSLLGTTLDDSTAALVENAKGIILLNSPGNGLPTIFTRGAYYDNLIFFNSLRGTDNVSTFSFHTLTKRLERVSSSAVTINCIKYNTVQSLTDTQKDTALSNIGLPLVHVDYSLIGSTLDDSTYNKLLTAKGVFLENVPDGNNAPSLFFVGSSDTVTTIFVSEFNARVWFVLTLSHTSKKLSLVSTGYVIDVVRYGEGQNLTDTQKQQARANINAVGSSMIKGVEIVQGTAPMQQDNILYIELEETT